MIFESICTTPCGDHFQRAKIFGGWIVTVSSNVSHIMEYNRIDDGYDWRTSITFVFDPFHLWRIKCTK